MYGCNSVRHYYLMKFLFNKNGNSFNLPFYFEHLLLIGSDAQQDVLFSLRIEI